MEHNEFPSLPEHYFDKWSKSKQSVLTVDVRTRTSTTQNLTIRWLTNIFTKKECDYYIAETERIGYKDVDWEYHKSYRSCKRVVVKSEALANEIWKRIMPDIKNNHQAMNAVRPYGFGNEGTWKPIGVNECIRFIKYDRNDHFQPHRDGIFVRTEDERSIYTLMIYLNDGYSGGATEVLDDTYGYYNRPMIPNSIEASSQILSEKGGIIPGTLVYFLHDLCHLARPVEDGVKYILRTDIMFRRIDAEKYNRQKPYLENPLFIQANALYYESIALQKKGDPKGSTLKYLEAQELQTKLASLSLNDSHNATLGDFQVFPLDIMRFILGFLPPSQILKMSTLNQAFSRITHDPLLWRFHYEKKWPDKRTIHLQEAVFEQTAKTLSTTLSIDWCACYRNRLVADKMFECVVVDVGFAETFYKVIQKKEIDHSRIEEISKKKWDFVYNSNYATIRSIPSLTAGVKGHYWSADSAYQNSYVGDEVQELGEYAYNQRGPFDLSFGLSEDVVIQILLYIYYKRDLPVLPSQNPLMLCIPPYWTETNVETLATKLLHELTFSYVCFLPTASLILLNFDQITGIVVIHERFALFVTPVFEGEPRQQLIRKLGKDSSPEEVFNEIIQIITTLDEKETAELLANIAVSGDGFASVGIKIDFCEGLKNQFSTYNGARKPAFFYSEDKLDTIHGAEVVCDLSPRGLFRDRNSNPPPTFESKTEDPQDIKELLKKKKKKDCAVM